MVHLQVLFQNWTVFEILFWIYMLTERPKPWKQMLCFTTIRIWGQFYLKMWKFEKVHYITPILGTCSLFFSIMSTHTKDSEMVLHVNMQCHSWTHNGDNVYEVAMQTLFQKYKTTTKWFLSSFTTSLMFIYMDNWIIAMQGLIKHNLQGIACM